jgi:hypothetical protein
MSNAEFCYAHARVKVAIDRAAGLDGFTTIARGFVEPNLVSALSDYVESKGNYAELNTKSPACQNRVARQAGRIALPIPYNLRTTLNCAPTAGAHALVSSRGRWRS